VSRKKKGAGKAAVPSAAWPAEGPGAAREAFVWWWRVLLPRLVPAILVGYATGFVSLGLYQWMKRHVAPGSPADVGGELFRLTLWLVGSAAGQAWGAALTLLAMAGCEPSLAAGWRVVRRRLGRLASGVAARAGVLYGPLVFLVLLIVTLQRRGTALSPNPLPLAELVIGSLAVNVAVMTALLAPAALVEDVGGVRAVAAARERSYGVWGGLLGWGVLLIGLIALSSIGPVQAPNHLGGSYLWVLLAVLYVRARRNAEPTWTRADLAAALGEEVAAPAR
jgi:hypothetical protein